MDFFDCVAEVMCMFIQLVYEDLIVMMECYVELVGDVNNGVWVLLEGQVFYESQLCNYIICNDMIVEEIYQIGFVEVECIYGEMCVIMEQVNFEGSLQDFFEFVWIDDQFYYFDSDEGCQCYFDEFIEMINVLMEVVL